MAKKLTRPNFGDLEILEDTGTQFKKRDLHLIETTPQSAPEGYKYCLCYYMEGKKKLVDTYILTDKEIAKMKSKEE